MPVVSVNGVDLHYESQGDGPPLVVVHGGWTDHTVWQAVADELTGSFRVIRYDRRGYSRSERPTGQRTRRQDEDDLAGIIETLAEGSAGVIASSFGGLVTLGLAGRRPELVESMCIHEAPSIPLAGGGEPGQLADEAVVGMAAVTEQIEAGDAEGGARRFVEELGVGPGAWELLPEPIRALFVSNASAVAAEQRDPDWSTLDIPAIAEGGHRLLLTKGTVGPLWLRALQGRLAEALPHAETADIEGAGHSPHMTHPTEFAGTVGSFMSGRVMS
jgi:pimeloyl-ACP methyl ester carboxylesterase